MTDSIDFHDYTIESLLVDARARRLILRAFYAHALSEPSLVAEFSGLAGYCLVGDVLGTIVSELEEREPFELYKQFAPQMQSAYGSSGGHDPWARSESEAAQFSLVAAFGDSNYLRASARSVAFGAKDSENG
jgi:hypothetical protein